MLRSTMLPKNSTHDDDSLTDVSLLISPINEDPTSKSSQLDQLTNDSVFQSLIAYANSFNLDETVYSIHDRKKQFDPTGSIRRTLSKQSQNKSTNSTKLIPSHFFSMKNFEDDYSEENTTVTDPSKFQWEHAIDRKDNDIEINSSSPIIIYEKTKDRLLPLIIDIQVLRSPTPIIVREILPKSNRFISKNHLPPSSNTFTQRSRSAKPPIIPKRQLSTNQYYPNKKIIIEYDQINIEVDRTIKQRKEIKRVNPNEYVQRYGSSLCSKEVFHKLYTTIVS